IKVSSSKVLRTDINDLIQNHPKLNTQTMPHSQKKTSTQCLPTTPTIQRNPQQLTTPTTQNNLLTQIFLPSTACTRLSHLATINSQTKKLQLYLHATII